MPVPTPPAPRKSGEKDPEQTKRIADCGQHIKSLEGQLAELEQDMAAKAAERDKAQRAYQNAFGQHVKAIGEIGQRIGYRLTYPRVVAEVCRSSKAAPHHIGLPPL